jgi:hypothetical protein
MRRCAASDVIPVKHREILQHNIQTGASQTPYSLGSKRPGGPEELERLPRGCPGSGGKCRGGRVQDARSRSRERRERVYIYLFIRSVRAPCAVLLYRLNISTSVIRKILEHLGLWEEAHAPPDRGPPEREITFDSSYSQLM